MDFLTVEMQNLSAEHDRPGWSQWVLLAALATFVWMAWDVMETSTVTGRGVALAALAIFLLIDSARLVHAQIAPHQSADRSLGDRFTFFREEHGNLRVPFLLGAARAGAMVFLLLWLDDTGLNLYHRAVTAVFYTLTALLLLLVFALSFTKLPSPLGTTRLRGGWRVLVWGMGFALIVVPGTAAAVVLYTILSTGGHPVIAEWKVAGLAVGSSLLLGTLTAKRKQLVVCDMLSDIRRRLALGHISTDSALRQADIALCGMMLDDIVKDELRTVMQSFSVGEQEARKAIALLETCEAMAANSKDDKAHASVLLASARDCLDKSKRIVDQLLEEQIRLLGKRVGLATRATPNAQSTEILAKIRSAGEALFNRYNDAVSKYNALMASRAGVGTGVKSLVPVTQVNQTEEKPGASAAAS